MCRMACLKSWLCTAADSDEPAGYAKQGALVTKHVAWQCQVDELAGYARQEHWVTKPDAWQG